ncbi:MULTISPECIES: multidrug/spermidine efflux SMR transporter subunit MdtI [Vibrio]|uniref:Spermidine export protein MdtI n=1 Tax=Vibrio proteolyticus NBRC 13287 TaxID=1219065 RepID=U3BNB1_VIBPR|nr:MULTISPECIES: multidrug/spermidine efflux SMR transporter subunit MdtI [Vibrio]NAW57451.1 multidrug/spermidine efflux SMR transporter subunit MdtI [Vibrio sp. V36_P2S2PM302]NAX23712.1 multidrug/spermidine efflux SMR transporter subunit MdtI [Vibrio sp. V39_P1S14PM300]NAX27138.1 multidrug/spermidine efflux SMR transporter subunit MdtI [Vibrio sp. V38_P2S17PM301]NAX30305.1 multidrug/spermidine efflux SMR transporter subunit MdtI [Vibrio sp. V37_P2S8PM304]GAD68068.1 spermidine export protein M
MNQFMTLSFGFVVLAAIVDIMANMALTRSDGFRHKIWGVTAIALVLAAFTLLAQAVKEIDLAVAYASWGAIGILGTAVGGSILFKQKLKPIGWAGIFVVIMAVVVMKTA